MCYVSLSRGTMGCSPFTVNVALSGHTRLFLAGADVCHMFI